MDGITNVGDVELPASTSEATAEATAASTEVAAASRTTSETGFGFAILHNKTVLSAHFR